MKDRKRPDRSGMRVGYLAVALLTTALATAAAPSAPPPITLRAWGVPDGSAFGAEAESLLRIMAAFREDQPHIQLRPATGLNIPGRGFDMNQLMQIAGDIAPDVLYVNFRQSDTYIRNKFLYPLDRYIEGLAGVALPAGAALDNAAYVDALRQGPGFAEHLEERVPAQCWEVMRRECPYGADCPYQHEWQRPAPAEHAHVWCLPQTPSIMVLFYRRDLFAEAGLPDRPPDSMEEFLQFARILTNPREKVYGTLMSLGETAWYTLSFLYSSGGRAVERDAEGRWRAVFDTPEAVDAYHYVARLFLEPFENAHGTFDSVVNLAANTDAGARYAMWFDYLNQRFFTQIDPNLVGFGPVPQGYTGLRGSEFNSQMTGIYAGIGDDPAQRDAAWEYMRFYGSREANLIRAEVYVRNGLGHFVRPELLRAGGYTEYLEKIPPGWEANVRAAFQHGIPEPYGKNCQQVYRYMNMAIDQIRTDGDVRRAIRADDPAAARARIAAILGDRVAGTNEKMLQVLPPDVQRLRTRVAMVVAVAILTAFVLVFRRVFRTFSTAIARSDADRARGEWQFGRHKLAYLILLPCLLSIGLWSYYPLLRGTLMAFQNYNARGFSEWVGLENFATVLFSGEFWYAMAVSLEYTLLFVAFGFVTPIALALLLSEVPRGKMLYRTIYYLPAVLSGVVVIFLWKSFYAPFGTINHLLNKIIALVNLVAGTGYAELTMDWLASPRFALFFCLLPTIWAGAGPGCLIYLAALKTIPDDLYEAADIDGAGLGHKVRHVTLPSIRALIMINLIGAVIGAMQSGSQFVLAMTGGGPYTPHGRTEVVGLHIFWEAFGYLRFGMATAMAWILGAMLLGFTVLQLQRLSRMEFKAAGGKDPLK